MPAKHAAGTEPSGVPVCGIGASAGGIEALQKFFSEIPDDLGLAYVVIVHLAPDRESDLPAIIGRWTRMPVIQVADHEKAKLVANQVYVIAPDRKLEITGTSVGASEFEHKRGQRAAIDLFFRSLAEVRGDGYAVILSGAGSDGALGARAVKEGGGLVLVQDPDEAGHPDMPRAVIGTGVADVILPVADLVARLSTLARNRPALSSLTAISERGTDTRGEAEQALRGVLAFIHKRTGNDFSKYKRATLLRRLGRRMQLSHSTTFSAYLEYLRNTPAEAQALVNDFLITVTSFFRDPDAWTALRTQGIASLVRNSQPDQQIRAWVTGCATGEEAYTLAILFHEEFEAQRLVPNLVIFASDVDEQALLKAREGLYPRAITADVPDPILDRYFRPEGDHYRVHNRIRDHVVFANHNLLRDPPFSRIDLITCRNLLIYLERELQEQVIGTFRYACRDDAILFLGASETVDEDLFRPLDKRHRIFITGPLPEGARPPLPDVLATPGSPTVRFSRSVPPARNTPEALHHSALEEVSPPSAVVDERGMVLHLSAAASRFLLQSAGPLAQRLIELVRPELRDELHGILHRAHETAEPQLSVFVRVAFNGSSRRVAMLAQRRPNPEGKRYHVLVTFLDAGPASAEDSAAPGEPGSSEVHHLREKLRQAERRIDSMRDDYYLTNEDLRAANEELQSLNEEYRSTTEELETSKEELQSINEELQTVNNELKQKLEEVSQANSDLENLTAATGLPILFLDRECRITRFTPELTRLFNIKPRDQERPIADITHILDYPHLEQDIRDVMATEHPAERHVTSQDGRAFLARLLPYRTTGSGDVAGVVITFLDLTEIKRAESALRQSEARLAHELEVTQMLHRTAMMVTSADHLPGALDEILSAAMTLSGAELGSIQLLEARTGKLKPVTHRGFPPDAIEPQERADQDDGSTSSRALTTRQISSIANVQSELQSVSLREAAAGAGYQALASVPMIAKEGELVGVLSLHFREPRQLSEREQQIGSILARQAADLVIARTQHDNLRRVNTELSRRTQELEASQTRLARHTAELLEQDRNKETFLAALGHELRNPLAAIHNGLEVIESAPNGPPRDAIAIARRQVSHLSRLVNDLLDVTRINHGLIRIQQEAVDLTDFVGAAVETVRRRAEAQGLAITVEAPPSPLYVLADPERLTQILDNLLANALSYTDEGSITVRLMVSGPEVQVEVRDTGIGVEPSEQQSVFDPFYRVHPRGQGRGLGLGLALVKRLVEMHEGRVSFHSDGLGKGSVVSFTLRLTEGAPSKPVNGLPQLPSRRVLVVDDQVDAAEMLGYLLEAMGQEVRVAHNGPEALEVAREFRPGLAFIDLLMPGMNGAELARRLRQEFPRDQLTLVALSGFPSDHPVARDGPFDHHAMKPGTTESLVELLST